MATFTKSLEKSISNAFALASEKNHQYVTLEHLLFSLMDEEDAVNVMKACSVDIGLLRENMKVDVRVDAFPFTTYGDVKGKIKSIAEESKTISQNDPNFYYETIISLDKQYIEKNNEKFFLKAGESISANIILEERPVIFVFSDIFETTWDKIKTIKSSS